MRVSIPPLPQYPFMAQLRKRKAQGQLAEKMITHFIILVLYVLVKSKISSFSVGTPYWINLPFLSKELPASILKQLTVASSLAITKVRVLRGESKDRKRYN